MSHRGPGSGPSRSAAKASGRGHAAPRTHGSPSRAWIVGGSALAVVLIVGGIAGWRGLTDDKPPSQAAVSAAGSPSVSPSLAGTPSASVTPSAPAAATTPAPSPTPASSKPSAAPTKATAKPTASKSKSKSKSPRPSSTPSKGNTGRGVLDPHYASCKEAKAHGDGPYRRGNDPEYYWYADPDDDGINCD